MATGFEDPYLTCPLDEVHRIRKSRMQCHLTKCLKNHQLMDKIKCPFNPLHIIYPNEMTHTIDTPAYDPIQANIDNPLFRTLNCESKSKRKEFRFRERQRIAAIEAEKGKKIVESTPEQRPVRELKPIRSHSVLATLADDDHPTVDNDVRSQGIMGENEEKKLEVSNGHNEMKNGTEDKTIEENLLNPIKNFDQLSVENDFDDFAKQLELLSQKENEIQRQRRALLEKIAEQATQQRITSELLLEKKSNESDNKNPFKNNSNDPIITKPSYSLTLERSFVPVEREIDVKSADAVANNPPKAAFELSSHLQSSAWNVVTKSKLNSSNSSTTSKISTPKPPEVPLAHPIVQPIAQLAIQTPSIEENSSVTPSSEWTTVSRSRKGSTLVDSTRKLQTSRESSPIPEAVWRRATGLKKMWSAEPQSISSSVHETTSWRKLDDSKEPSLTTESVQLNVEKLHEPSSEHQDLTWAKVAAQKEAPSTLKLKSWNNSISRENSPVREETPWNKVATLRETSITPESPPWTVMTRSKKVSSSQQCTQWKLAPETVETVEITELSPADMIDSLKKSKFFHLVSSDKDSKSNETLPASALNLIDTKPKVKPVLKDSSEKSTLVSRTITPSSVSSSYSTMAKITKDKPSENPPMKTMSSSNEFLPTPRRSKISSLFNSQNLNRVPGPGAGRGIIHIVDEMKHKKNDILSRRLRPGSASSFCSSFDQIDIEGVYGYEETV
ncbi:Protein of unknown function [Cotesia congregata]|uniref:CHHC U11-48K-type domain-containing protein n=1 Tax=Cotesia congregata TaxID=51543 RepID=A0A8J2HPM3_COTCN|nr:Protein of unknown function [Cotesia congregata]